MKYLVISDTHGCKNYLKRIVRREEDIKNIIFLGDGIGDAVSLKAERPDLEFIAVAGNCDINKAIPTKEIFTSKGYRILACHGDGYYVKMGLLPLRRACMEMGIDIALYGHTHNRYYEYYDGLYMFNPGSVLPSSNPFPCYGIMDLDGDKPCFYHGELR